MNNFYFYNRFIYHLSSYVIIYIMIITKSYFVKGIADTLCSSKAVEFYLLNSLRVSSEERPSDHITTENPF
jgi:hypothetical protein